MVERADVVVLGMGPGGEDVAGRLAEAGVDVIGVEAGLVGGECPYWGCVPSKMMLRAAHLVAEARRIPGMAGSVEVVPDWAPVAARIREEATDNWDDRVAVERFVGKGGRFVRGRGRIDGPGRVSVDGRVIEASAVVVATGTSPAVPAIPGLADLPYWTNREVVEAKDLPASLVVLGGGAIGLEMGQALARFGVRVMVVEAQDRLLPAEEPEAGSLLEKVLAAEGMEIHRAVRVVSAGRRGAELALTLADGSIVSGERLLVATGRRPDLRAVGVGSVGLDEEAPFVAVDGHLRAAPGVWAVGDVTGVGAFTHVAAYQAAIAANDILGRTGPPADYRALPRVTFTDPEVASVGLSEVAARERGLVVHTAIARVPSSARGWIHKAGNEGFVKLVVDDGRDVVVGATSAGPAGGEVLSMLTLAVHAEVPVASLRRMIYAYPTFHRAVEDALQNLSDG